MASATCSRCVSWSTSPTTGNGTDQTRVVPSCAVYDMSVARLEARIGALANETWEHPDANRLAKRLSKHGNELLTFLWYTDVPSDNNAGERAIRPAVMIRKNSYCNHSDRGALTQSVLMSVLRTLRVRGHQPLDTILSSLADYSRTGILPPLPPKALTAG
jgi:transposase